MGREFQRDYDGPCICETSGHTLTNDTCYEWVTRDYSSGPCYRPVKERIRIKRRQIRFGAGSRDGEIEVGVCGLHLGVMRRAEAKAARWAAEQQADREDRERRKELCAAVDDSIEHARRIFAEVGLDIPIEHDHGQYGRCGGGIRIGHEHLRAIVQVMADGAALDLPGYLR